MSFRLLLTTALLATTFGTAVNVDAAGFERDGRKISLQIPQTSNNNVRAMRLTVVSDDIIRVEATPDEAIPAKRKSLVVVNREGKYKADVKEDDSKLTLETAKLTVTVDKATGKLTFVDKTTGKVLLKEADGSKTFTRYVSSQTELPENYRPTSPDEVNWGKTTDLNKLSLEDRSGYSWHALFESDPNEAFYGLGQHQSEEMN